MKHLKLVVVALLFSIIASAQSGLKSLEIKEVSEITPVGLDLRMMVWDSLNFGKVKYAKLSEIAAALGITNTAELNDLSAAVVWDSVPNPFITRASVLQHQAYFNITKSQITDFVEANPGLDDVTSVDDTSTRPFIASGTNGTTEVGGGYLSVFGLNNRFFQINQADDRMYFRGSNNTLNWLNLPNFTSSSLSWSFPEASGTFVVEVDPSGFSGNLSSTDDTYQKVAQKFDAFNSGAGSGLQNIVEDLSPQLGEDLDLNGNNIVSGASDFIYFKLGSEELLTIAPFNVAIGKNDTYQANLRLFGGPGTGGNMFFYNGNFDDTNTDFWQLIADEDFKIFNSGNSSTTPALAIDDLTNVVSAPLMSDADINSFGDNALITKRYFDNNSGGSSSSDYIGNISLTSNILSFSAIGTAFDGSVDLSAYDQEADEVTFTPYLENTATDVQGAIQSNKDEINALEASIPSNIIDVIEITADTTLVEADIKAGKVFVIVGDIDTTITLPEITTTEFTPITIHQEGTGTATVIPSENVNQKQYEQSFNGNDTNALSLYAREDNTYHLHRGDSTIVSVYTPPSGSLRPSWVDTYNGVSTTLTTTVTATPTSGNYLVAKISAGDFSTIDAPPAGWTELHRVNNSFGTFAFFVKESDGSETSVDFTKTGGNGRIFLATIDEFENVSDATAYESLQTGSRLENTTATIQSVTSTNANSLAVSFLAMEDINNIDDSITANPSNYSIIDEFSSNLDSGAWHILLSQNIEVETLASDSIIFDHSAVHVVMTLVLNPN